MTTRSFSVALAVLLVAGCSTANEPAGERPAGSGASSASVMSTPAPTPAPTPMAAAIREWEARTGDLFTRSAHALHQVSEASDAGDEAAVRSGCQQLHVANAVQLQRLLPTPDPELTAELQRMIDDMNAATHACLRFVIARQSADSMNYQDYLTRAVEHLQQAKAILDADLHADR
jgi:hypothetical protein